MEKRRLGKTTLELPILSFGASSLGAEFRGVSLSEVFRSVEVALELGMNFIDTSPFYGRGMSEVLLGIALKDVPRESYNICTKLEGTMSGTLIFPSDALPKASTCHSIGLVAAIWISFCAMISNLFR